MAHYKFDSIEDLRDTFVGYSTAEDGHWSVAWKKSGKVATVFYDFEEVGSLGLPRRKAPFDGLKFCKRMTETNAKSIVDAVTILYEKQK